MDKYLEMLEVLYKVKNIHLESFLPAGLTHGEYYVILKLKNLEKKEEKITSSYFVNTLHISSAAISRTIKHIEEKGYVMRICDDNDRRNYYLKVTKNGNEVVTKLENNMKKYIQKVYKYFGEERFQDFIKCLNDLYDISVDKREMKENIK